MSTTTHRSAGPRAALRQLRDPLLLFGAPVAFALLVVLAGPASAWPLGFDFRGTLLEPARALLDGAPLYPEPTQEAIVDGNPAVYPPLFVLAAVPFTLLSSGVAAFVWAVALGCSLTAALWIVGVRDWRCHVLAVTSPVVVQGLYFGNLTILLGLPLALAWRHRDRAGAAGLAVGVAIAAKLFVLPLVGWLLVTRRFAGAAWSVGTAGVLLLGSWALVGFEGLADYPALLRVVQEVYAVHSYSLATVVAALNASEAAAVGVAAGAGLALVGVAAVVAGRRDGDRRAFSLVVAACIIASPITWPNYAALLFVPVAVTWPRLAPAWFFGYAAWLAEAIAPRPVVSDESVIPPGVTEQAWLASHTDPFLWYGAGLVGVVVAVTMLLALPRPTAEP